MALAPEISIHLIEREDGGVSVRFDPPLTSVPVPRRNGAYAVAAVLEIALEQLKQGNQEPMRAATRNRSVN
jgi:hypothetical protein